MSNWDKLCRLGIIKSIFHGRNAEQYSANLDISDIIFVSNGWVGQSVAKCSFEISLSFLKWIYNRTKLILQIRPYMKFPSNIAPSKIFSNFRGMFIEWKRPFRLRANLKILRGWKNRWRFRVKKWAFRYDIYICTFRVRKAKNLLQK